MSSNIDIKARLSGILVRNVRAMGHLEIFLISGVTTILLIRLFLQATGFPQLGGESLHIAHMLWGGLGMLVAILVRMMFLGKWVEYFSTFIGGVGFGAFIDEIGKFVTQDNNYFFAPAFSLMYIIFVLIYLIAHWALTGRGYSRNEYLMNSLNYLQDYRYGYLPENIKREVQYFLSRYFQQDPLTEGLSGFLSVVPSRPAAKENFYGKIKAKLRDIYVRIIERRYFAPLLNIFFIFQLITGVAFILQEIFYPEGFDEEPREPSYSQISLLVTTGLSAFCIFIGVLHLRRSRLKAYKWFERAMLVNILLSQIFLFTLNQLGAMTGLIFSLLVLGAIRFLIAQETNKMVSEQVASEANSD